MKVTHHSSSYFLGDSSKDSLQRIYGISFPTVTQLNEYIEMRAKARERDHRKIGLEQSMFFFHEYSPGSCFFLPNGAHIYNTLIDFLRKEYKKRGFKEVLSPNIFSTHLWEQSGHLANYRDNMFIFGVDDKEYALKPMNCPGHCIMFKHAYRSYRELPLRFADFGVLHRNELSGTLTGLTRSRRFQQDDAHIFCATEQVEDEIKGCLEFLDYVYGVFKFTYELRLGTRPKNYIGDLKLWDEAEGRLQNALKCVGKDYSINEGDGAFYGPKIDIILYDALKRKMQCATIQLDFQLPIRFDLRYSDKDGSLRVPVIIHRAIFGSLERMIAILIESYGKRLPFWLNPKQIAIVSKCDDYAYKVRNALNDYEVDILDDPSMTFRKKICVAAMGGYSLVFVVGEKEAESGEVFVMKKKSYKLEKIKEMLEEMKCEKKEIDEIIDIDELKV
jgi:threonyl-tRNA synthetase